LLNMEVFTWMIGNFQTPKSLNVREREYRCLCSYYVINTYASLMYELKKMERYLRVTLLSPGPSSYRKTYLPGRGLIKVGKHCSRRYPWHSFLLQAESPAGLEVCKTIKIPVTFSTAGHTRQIVIHISYIHNTDIVWVAPEVNTTPWWWQWIAETCWGKIWNALINQTTTLTHLLVTSYRCNNIVLDDSELIIISTTALL
jgi:hypothetical protein